MTAIGKFLLLVIVLLGVACGAWFVISARLDGQPRRGAATTTDATATGTTADLSVPAAAARNGSGDDASLVGSTSGSFLTDLGTVPPTASPKASTLQSTRGNSNSPATMSSDTTAPVPAPKPVISLGYSTVLLRATYAIAWTSPFAGYGTIALTRAGTTIEPLAGCSKVPVVKGAVQYCAWTKNELDRFAPTDGYSLMLTVTSASGGVLGRAASAPFSFVTQVSYNVAVYKDNLDGWSVRYPQGWHVASGVKTTFSASNGSSAETLSVEACSLAREACATRVEDFGRTAGVTGVTVAGKQASMNSVARTGGYTAEYLLKRDGTAFFIRVPTVDRHGLAASPYAALTLASFGYETANRTVKQYALDASFRAGTLYVEYQYGRVAYFRLFAGARACSIEASGGTFTTATGERFTYKTGSCTIKGTTQGSTMVLTEDGCESLHTGAECVFKGNYVNEAW